MQTKRREFTENCQLIKNRLASSEYAKNLQTDSIGESGADELVECLSAGLMADLRNYDPIYFLGVKYEAVRRLISFSPQKSHGFVEDIHRIWDLTKALFQVSGPGVLGSGTGARSMGSLFFDRDEPVVTKVKEHVKRLLDKTFADNPIKRYLTGAVDGDTPESSKKDAELQAIRQFRKLGGTFAKYRLEAERLQPFAAAALDAARLLAKAEQEASVLEAAGAGARGSAIENQTAAATPADSVLSDIQRELAKVLAALSKPARDELEGILRDAAHRFDQNVGRVVRARRDSQPIESMDDFYSALNDHGFVFVSDVRQELQSGEIWRRVTDGALAKVMLNLGFVAYVRPESFLEGRQAAGRTK